MEHVTRQIPRNAYENNEFLDHLIFSLTGSENYENHFKVEFRDFLDLQGNS